MSLLKNIHSPEDLKALSPQQLPGLCEEIRTELIRVVSQNGGHLASNLGVVELTVALHRRFQSPKDKIVFDVGHQCYTHKLLTGRSDRFYTLRTEDGLSGFTRPEESEHDVFVSGHSSTSVSAGYGIAAANQLQGSPHYVISVIGDGALTGGLVWEALNNAGRKNSNLIVILNDNKMSISKNVGAMARYLAVIRSRPKYYRFKSRIERVLLAIPGIGKSMRNGLLRFKRWIKSLFYNSTVFEDMGFAYLGPIDGHDLEALDNCLTTAMAMRRPVFIHALTVKGKGYPHAEKNPGQYHGIASMDIETGECPPAKDSFSFQAGRLICRKAEKDQSICAITAAMTEGCGLSEFRAQFPSRFFDVGIAEGHAITFASGLSKGGMHPVVFLYSTFLQRGYDQLIHDAAIQGLPMTLCVDRAGFVGEDGETHQGLFDVSFLGSIPGVRIWSPADYRELEWMMEEALAYPGLSVVRYPRGSQSTLPEPSSQPGSAVTVWGSPQAENVLVTYGRLAASAATAAEELTDRGIPTRVVKFNRILPLPEEGFSLLEGARRVFFYEEGMCAGGVGERLLAALLQRGLTPEVKLTAVKDEFVPQAPVASCLRRYGMDVQSMVENVISAIGNEGAENGNQTKA